MIITIETPPARDAREAVLMRLVGALRAARLEVCQALGEAAYDDEVDRALHGLGEGVIEKLDEAGRLVGRFANRP
jgi:hypothetical protein